VLGRERAPVEHGFADLKNWRILSKVRMNAGHATQLCAPCSWSPAPRSPADQPAPAACHSKH
jgi:hypothetical protein